MTRQSTFVVAMLLAAAVAPGAAEEAPDKKPWSLAESAEELVTDPALRDRIFEALDAAALAGTDPSISKFHVRAGTAFEHHGQHLAIVGGNSEYFGYPEAIHGETSLLNNVISEVGPEAAREGVDFLAFYGERKCGGGGSCGDCRDYIMTTTRWQDLLMVCGQATDHTVHVNRFAKWVVPETDFPVVTAEETGLPPDQLEALVSAALEARAGGVSLFTSPEEHLGGAALTTKGEIYRAAGADDAAFHYRYAVGAALQQAATYRDYHVQAVAVVAAPGHTARVSYRDRQYGYEFSSFNAKRELPPIKLIVIEESATEPRELRYRMTTFEEALPGAFSAASFMPDAVDRFLGERPER